MNSPFQILHPKASQVLLLTALTFAAAGASAQSDEVMTLDIKPQKAGSALVTLAQASGMQILFAEGTATQVEVHGLKGEYRLEKALEALLADTDLEYRFTAENLILVQDVEDAAEQESEVDEEGLVEEDDDPLELSEQRVTGSRLEGGDPSARVYSYSAEDIAVRGVSSIEEFFRTLPWVFSSITTQTNSFGEFDSFDNDAEDISISGFSLGTSTLNLRSMGSANTLVLVDGRRVAGLAGEENSPVNIANIPLSAIERVEIQLDGTSAVYGADAIGGVVNFITKKNYEGLSATWREEFSSSDADRRSLSLQGGYAWGSGSITATLERSRSKPINNHKLWTSGDFSAQFGPEFDLRLRDQGQPGVVTPARNVVVQLPAGHSGVGAAETDFTSEIIPFDYVLPKNGADATHTSLTLRVGQYLGDDLYLYASALASNRDSYLEHEPRMNRYSVPASNAYNPFGRTVRVSYWPVREIESGLISPPYRAREFRDRNYTAGLTWEFAADHQFELNVGRSESKSIGQHIDASNSTRRPPELLAARQRVLASSDPDVAVNLFGDGSAQTSGLAEMFGWGVFGMNRTGVSTAMTHDFLLRGSLLEIWGGRIRYVVGADSNKEVIYNRHGIWRDGEFSTGTGEANTGLQRPEQKLTGTFAELALPVVGRDNARPGLRSLVLSLQARRDEHEFTGAAGGSRLEFNPVTFRLEIVGEPNLVEVKKAATTLRTGLQYRPLETLIVRAAWSEAFQPPVFGDQFSIWDPSRFTRPVAGCLVDPDHPDGSAEPVCPGSASRVFNPDLRPESANKYSLGFEWTPQSVPGLRWLADWTRVDFTDKLTRSGAIVTGGEVAVEDWYIVPGVVIRDADGYWTHIAFMTINLNEKISEILENSFEYAFETSVGSFTSRLTYTKILDEYFTLVPGGKRVGRSGSLSGSDEYTLAGSLAWTWRQFGADLFVHHIPSYENRYPGHCTTDFGVCGEPGVYRLPAIDVDSLTTVDLTVTYLFGNGLQLRAGGRNILNEQSDTVWNSLPYDPTRWDARGRVFFLELNWEL